VEVVPPPLLAPPALVVTEVPALEPLHPTPKPNSNMAEVARPKRGLIGRVAGLLAAETGIRAEVNMGGYVIVALVKSFRHLWRVNFQTCAAPDCANCAIRRDLSTRFLDPRTNRGLAPRLLTVSRRC